MENSDHNIQGLVDLVNLIAFESIKNILSDITAKYGDEKMGVAKFQDIFLQFLFFYLHQISRTAQDALEINKAVNIIQKLLSALSETVRIFKEDGIDRQIFIRNYNDSESEYSKCDSLKLTQSVLVKRIFKNLDLDYDNPSSTEYRLEEEIIKVSSEKIKKYWSNEAMQHYLIGIAN